MIKKLSDLKIGENGNIEDIVGSNRAVFLQMGLTKGTAISVNRAAPFGSPIDVIVRNCHLMMRKEEAENILVDMK